MQLKTIRAYGFKSFADKIELEIKDGITGIVGPNGSGKSNIVDAIKWVLGEQSIKALRGSKEMSDVIFQGSESRKPSTRASVSLVFDNQDHYLNSEYQEIEIKRAIYAGGENEYSINGSKVRLKDITDLFLDSGAGKEAFSIISQGKITEIVSSKPEERRAIIEEAAGVLKYKKRKTEALRKLDKTNDNLVKINLVLNEIETSLEPLKEQSEKAKVYNSYKEELENVEISLLVKDITEMNIEYEKLKEENEKLKEEIENLSVSNNKDASNVEKLKLKLLKLEEEINNGSKKLLAITEELSSIEANKQILVERKKFEVEDSKLASNIINLKEEILQLENDIKTVKDKIKLEEERNARNCSTKEKLLVDYQKLNVSKQNLNSEIDFENRLLNDLKNKIEIAEANLENNTLLPYSVKSILNNSRLKGVKGTLSSLFKVKDGYNVAIETALGFNQNVLICTDENVAKSCISFLKENKLGRATFFPMNIIKPKSISENFLEIIKNENGYLGIASSFLEYDEEYTGVIKNQLGNVIIVKDIDSMNRIGKLVNYTYRVVTLGGEILHSGGSITGGEKNNTAKSTLTEKSFLENSRKEYDKIQKNLEYNLEKLKETEKELEIVLKSLNENESLLVTSSETLKQYNLNLNVLNASLSNKNDELSGNLNMKQGSLDKALEESIEKFYEKENEKNLLSSKLEELKREKSDLSTELNEIELNNRKLNTDYNKKISNQKEVEVKLSKLDVHLDNMLLRLTDEYDMTYEKAKRLYFDVKVDENAREKVQSLRRKIKDLGEVNIGSIVEFSRVNTRYEFLNTQKEDLVVSTNELLSMINEMDEQMEKDFKDAFDKVNAEFKVVFNKLFRGGHGEIILTNPENLLETGVDIIAEPPGKKLKNINLLSGGEKTLTAISLLFAILNVKIVPFCILDEVEAALDEANVDTFGTYLKEYEHKTQFIVITHKKKTMEYANNLYGITMQESGVSKLVSVRLENI